MNVLVTAGNTLALLDRVRCLTNVFTGRTGAGIALEALERGHQVTLLTSHPEVLRDLAKPGWDAQRLRLEPYRTFDDLKSLMASHVPLPGLDAIVHCAAVSDYLPQGVYAPAEGTCFESANSEWRGSPPTLTDRRRGKIKSDEPELWVRLVRAPKLVDSIRAEWGFRRILVKFKLEVGLSDEELLDVAERSRQQSRADWMVANTLEGSASHAFLGDGAGRYERVARARLPARLMDRLEESLRAFDSEQG